MKNSSRLIQHLHIFFYLFLFLSAFIASSQEYSLGLKAGGSYSLNDNGSEIFGNGQRFSAESDFGYLGGAFFELEFGKWLVRPEVFYSSANGEFVFPNSSAKYNINKLSIPLLLGYNIYGPVDIYAGPAYQVIIDKNLENTRSTISQDHNNLAAQVGFKLGFNRWELDLRYDLTLPSDDFQRVDLINGFNNAFFDDGRLNQIMLSLSYKIFGSDLSPIRRGGSCYF